MTDVGTISASGNNTITKTSGDAIFAAVNNNGRIELHASTNRGVYDRTNTKWLIGTNGTNTWLACGNVAIASSANTTYKLYVDGTVGVTGNTTLGGTLGVIGATTLSSTLSVSGTCTVDEGLYKRNADSHPLSLWRFTDSNQKLDIYVHDVLAVLNASDSDGWSSFSFCTNGTEYVRFDGLNKRVGIGITSP
jgi:hypothetical protein